MACLILSMNVRRLRNASLDRRHVPDALIYRGLHGAIARYRGHRAACRSDRKTRRSHRRHDSAISRGAAVRDNAQAERTDLVPDFVMSASPWNLP